jgi:hypothetical protein
MGRVDAIKNEYGERKEKSRTPPSPFSAYMPIMNLTIAYVS